MRSVKLGTVQRSRYWWFSQKLKSKHTVIIKT